jgi:RES domain-containing protein
VRTKQLRLLDLMDAEVRRALGVSEQDLIGDDLTRCQEIAQYARNAGYEAILAPSAALKCTRTLAIFASAIQKVTEQHSHVGRPPPRTRHVLSRMRHKA